jgi:hypothetical protein
MALPQEKKTRGRLKQSEGEGGNGDEGKAKGYRAGGVIAMASSARRRKTAWARTVRAATHSSCRSVAWSPSPSAPSRAAVALEILRRKPAAFSSQAPIVSATTGKNSTPCPRHAAALSKCAALVSAYYAESGRQTGVRSFSQGFLLRGGRDGQVKGSR